MVNEEILTEILEELKEQTDLLKKMESWLDEIATKE